MKKKLTFRQNLTVRGFGLLLFLAPRTGMRMMVRVFRATNKQRKRVQRERAEAARNN